MEDPKKANETLQKLEDRDVRIIYLPPMTVAAARISGEAELIYPITWFCCLLI